MSMVKILDKLYLGDYLCSINRPLLKSAGITHIVTVLDQCRRAFKDVNYFCIKLSDSPTTNIAKHFPGAIEFIHQARLSGHSVLVHCAQGVSRSVTIIVAYLLTISKLPWQRCLNAVQTVRRIANPNFGFRQQLGLYEKALRNDNNADSSKNKYANYQNREDDLKGLQRLMPTPTANAKRHNHTHIEFAGGC